MSHLLRTLDEIEGTDLPCVGNKAYRLALLRQNGLNVPAGVVLTTQFFEAQLKHFRLTPLWSGSPDVEVTTEALSWLADTIKTKPLARELAQQLNRVVSREFGFELDSFAVRSSAIDEDQRGHSFAGVHLTELGVPRFMLPVAISRCWASALNEAATKYRLVHGMSIQQIQMAIILQPMVNPICAGVGFTADPLTGEQNQFVIEANWGLGEAVVRGEHQPYFYRLANDPPAYPLLEHHPGTPPTAAPPAQADTEPLSSTDLQTLVTQLVHIEALMGEAQDVEWSKTTDGLFILQARPVILPAVNKETLDQAWVKLNVEGVPAYPSPFFVSLLTHAQQQTPDLLSQLGLETEPFGPFIKPILGQLYLNLSMLRKVVSQVGLSADLVLQLIGQVPPTGDVQFVDWAQVWRTRTIYQQIWELYQQVDEEVAQYERAAVEAIQMLNETDFSQPHHTLQTRFRLHSQLYHRFYRAYFTLHTSLAVLTGLESYLLQPITENPLDWMKQFVEQESYQHGLLADLEPLKNEAETLLNISAWPPNADQVGKPLVETLLNLHQKYQYCGRNEADPACPRYGEAPDQFLEAVKHHLRTQPDRAHLSKIKEQLGLFSWRRWPVRQLLSRVKELLAIRARLRASRTQTTAVTRQWCLNLAACWVARGWLHALNDIFWLTTAEVERTLLIGAEAGLVLQSTITARQETYRTYQQTGVPDVLWDSQLHAIQFGQSAQFELDTSNIQPMRLEDVVLGQPISPGQVRGTALVIHHPHEFKAISEEIILVTASTSPEWLTLLSQVKGLIVQVGGLLSHSSIIAREYGLPSVANIPEALERFQTGDQLLVDGTTGVVQVLTRSR